MPCSHPKFSLSPRLDFILFTQVTCRLSFSSCSWSKADKRERDRERNRVHARESRARKKKKMEDLEGRCSALEARVSGVFDARR